MSYKMRYSREGTVVIFCDDTGYRWDLTPDEADRLAFSAAKQEGKFKDLKFYDMDGYLIEMQLEDVDKGLAEQISLLASAARHQLGMRPN